MSDTPDPGAFTVRPVATDNDWALASEIRRIVFVVEQRCAESDEFDEFDDRSRHLLGWSGSTAVAASRWRSVDHDGTLVAKLERFSVLSEYRGRGLGRRLIEGTISDARQAGFAAFLVHSQAHLAPLYASLGFETFGAVFEEVGIPHVRMKLTDPGT